MSLSLFHKYRLETQGIWAAGLLLTAGCANDAVVFTTATRTGLDINAADAGQQGVHFGHERFEGVIMPAVHQVSSNEVVYLKQAYPVYAEYEFRSGSLRLADGTSSTNEGLILHQVFATGRAAGIPEVQEKARSDFSLIGGKLLDGPTVQAGQSLFNYMNNAANPEAMKQGILDAVNASITNGAKVTTLDEAATRLRTDPQLRAKIPEIRSKLGLK
ncbi:MAG TPA: hypothetical protein VMF06_05140 [Candidatus Limnocylindria bacterium]|jgi:hypothetical protein|nr:hypothetical protein [Candidatus Limnocylindria bacterium]